MSQSIPPVGAKKVPRLQLLENLRQARRQQLAPATYMPISLHDPRIFMATVTSPVSETVIMKTAKGDLPMPVRKVAELINKGEAYFALDRKTNDSYLVSCELINQYAKDIYNFESAVATNMMDLRLQVSPELEVAKKVFFRVEEYILQNSTPGNLRHLSFILREMAENGGDYTTATAVLLHNFEEKVAKKILKSGQKNSEALRQMIKAVLTTITQFKSINGVPFAPAPKTDQYYIQDSIDALIKIARGDWRALLLFLTHKLSAITMQEADGNNITERAVDLLYAPLSERFGLRDLACKLKNGVFRLHFPVEHALAEKAITDAIGMSIPEAEYFLVQREAKLTRTFTEENFTPILSRSRVKTPASAHNKTICKAEEYSEIFLQEDILAMMVVVDNPLTHDVACKLVQTALQDEFLNFTGNSEEKIIVIDNQRMVVHHLNVLLRGGNTIEIQIMDKTAFAIRERGALAHWAYKVRQIDHDQKFDKQLLETCGRQMNGDFAHDAAMLNYILGSRTFVFLDIGGCFIQPVRLPTGAIPLDIVYRAGRPIAAYGGIKTAKVWEPRNTLKIASEESPLSDGDLIVFNPSKLGYLKDHIISKALKPAYAETGALLGNLRIAKSFLRG